MASEAAVKLYQAVQTGKLSDVEAALTSCTPADVNAHAGPINPDPNVRARYYFGSNVIVPYRLAVGAAEEFLRLGS